MFMEDFKLKIPFRCKIRMCNDFGAHRMADGKIQVQSKGNYKPVLLKFIKNCLYCKREIIAGYFEVKERRCA